MLNTVFMTIYFAITGFFLKVNKNTKTSIHSAAKRRQNPTLGLLLVVSIAEGHDRLRGRIKSRNY